MAIHWNQTGGIEVSPSVIKFGEDVLSGLKSSPKFLHSKYFYDAEGDKIFQRIMNLPEYYLTRCEFEIFSRQTKELCDSFLKRFSEFDIVELGAGDATKSIYLLEYLSKSGLNFTYYPIDISENIISSLEAKLPEKIPGLKVCGLNGEYFDMIKEVNKISGRRKIFLFLGSNIGNFSTFEAALFLNSIHEHLLSGDLMLIGFDLKKNPSQILAAYNDASGTTKEFNLNLLRRINKELSANFDTGNFMHYPSYDPLSGTCNSYLISLKHHFVSIGENEIEFQNNEPVHLEISQKYSVKEIESLTENAGFKPINYFYDSKKWFLDILVENKPV